MTREQIIKALIELFQDDDDIYALWLEGSDATGKVDITVKKHSSILTKMGEYFS